MQIYSRLVGIMPLAAIYCTCSSQAYAQTVDAAPPPAASVANAASIATIEVTGSRIRESDVSSANPITTISSDVMAKTDTIQLEDILRKTPAVDFTGGSSGNDGYGGFGASFVGLRNLGAQRTLVLVNGERFTYTDNESTDLAVDMNNIPVSIIDHVDILRDGASSIYGADAIGGVINIITKQHFNGVEVGGDVGETSYGDGLKYGGYSTVGADLPRGNVLLSASYQHDDAIPQANRSWANDEYLGTIAAYDQVSSRVPGAIALINNGSSSTKYYFYNQAGNFAPVSDSGFWNSHAGQLPKGVLYTGDSIVYDFEPTELLNTSEDIRSFSAQGNYDLTDDITFVGDGFYTDRYSVENENPQPLGYNIGTPNFPNGLFIPAYLENGTNADGTPIYVLNSAGQKILNPYNPTTIGNKIVANPGAAFGGGAINSDVPILTRRFEDGARYYEENVDTYRLHVGLEGVLFSNYDWNVNYSYGQSNAVDKYVNDVNFYHLAQESGQYACSAPEVAEGCSTANFFGYNTLTPAQAKYISYTETRNSTYELQDTNGSISGPVPFAELPGGPVKASIGYEYRTDSLDDEPDSVQVEGDADSTAAPTQGGYATASGFIEVNAPVFKDVPFAKLLTIDASSRYDYNTVFNRALTWKAGFDWAPTEDIRFRGGRSTGFRGPQIKELYGGLYEVNPSADDPCAPGGISVNNPTCLAQIRAVDPSYNPKVDSLTQLNQINAETGGNPLLKPETSQEWDLGTVITPHWVKNLSIAADFYQVLVRDSIGVYDAQSILNFCYGGQPYAITKAQCFRTASNPTGLIGPRTATGDLGYVYTLADNLGNEDTSGLDLTVNYSFDTQDVDLPAFGKIILTGQADYLLRDTLHLPTGQLQQAGTYNVAGTAEGDGGTGEPRWKANLGATVVHDEFAVYVGERYYGGLKAQEVYSESGGGCGTMVGCGDYFGNEAAGVFYTDLSVTYAHDDFKVTVGVDNMFDKDPPIIATATNGALSDAGYDFQGRFVYMKASIKFGLPTTPSAAPLPPPPPPPAPAPAPVAPTALEKERQFQVFFDFNKSDITSAAAKVIQEASEVIKAGGVAHIIVTGHTDTVGTSAYNQVLSEKRAASVKAKLVSDGVDGGEIATNGVGKTGLLVPTADGVREPQNRRAVIELL